MALFHITPSKSVFTNVAAANAFDGGGAGPDTLIVDQGAFLTATAGGMGAFLENRGAWTVTINGAVTGEGSVGLALDLNNAATSHVTVGATGSVSTMVFGSAADLVNNGHIGTFVAFSSKSIVNGGRIDSGLLLLTANQTTVRNSGFIGDTGLLSIQVQDVNSTGIRVVNSGTISAGVGGTATGADTVVNSGTIGLPQAGGGTIDLLQGNNRVVNSGTVNGVYIGGNDRDTVVNTKTWFGNIGLGDGINQVVNSGNIGVTPDTGLSLPANIVGGNAADSIVNSGTITGYVELGQGQNSLLNSGRIGDSPASLLLVNCGEGNDTIRNSGVIIGNVILGNGDNLLVNTGRISMSSFVATGGSIAGGDGRDTVINSGLLDGDVGLGAGTNILRNAGTIKGAVAAALGDDIVTNTKTIGGGVNLGDGTNRFVNTGSIGVDAATKTSYTGGTGADTAINSGTLAATVNLGDGKNRFVNSGVIRGTYTGLAAPFIGDQYKDGEVLAGNGDDTIINSGTINGVVDLGHGTNLLRNTGFIRGSLFSNNSGGVVGGFGTDTVINTGRITSFVDLKSGDDVFIGGRFSDFVVDGDGADLVRLAGGDDIYAATGNTGADGADTIDGGAGIDLYDASVSGLGNVINLDTVAHDGIAANFGSGSDISFASTDIIRNFENVIGGSGGDTVHGSAVGNKLTGNDGDDALFGYGGQDTLEGGFGKDTLTGGAGADVLTGGADADTFVFLASTDSRLAVRDTITDFEAGLDTIDLSAIDANLLTSAVNDTFTFIGTNVAFSKTAGELRANFSGNDLRVEGDVNGDGLADFAITLTDTQPHAITLAGADFKL